MGAEDHRDRAEVQDDDDRARPVVELRHEAGLTAGQTLPLQPGTFRFGPLRSDLGGLVIGTPEAVSFELSVSDSGATTLTAGQEPVAVEGVVIDRPVPLDPGDVVQLTTDQFRLDTVAPPHRDRDTRPIEPRAIPPLEPLRLVPWFVLCGVVIVAGVLLAFVNVRFIGISLIGLAGLLSVLLFRSRRSAQLRDARSIAVANARSLLFNELVEARKVAAEAMRTDAPTPAAITRRAEQSKGSAHDRLLVTIASGDRAWDPPIVVRRTPGWDYRSIAEDLSFLPAVPYTVDLDAGPIAVTGSRAATLAVARHLATTVMALSGPSHGAAVETEIPADWRWLADRPNAALRILDRVGGPLRPRTVVLADDADQLEQLGVPSERLTIVMEVDDRGRATITTSEGDTGTGFVPHGITEQHARELQQLLDGSVPVDDDTSAVTGPLTDARPTTFGAVAGSETERRRDGGLEMLDTARLLVTGPDRSRNKDVLATAALQQAVLHPDRELYILDRGDRALIRLTQLDSCIRYTTLDRVDGVRALVDELDRLTAEQPPGFRLLLAPDLWSTIDFYRTCGLGDLADRLDAVVAEMELVPIAASSLTAEVPTAAFLVWIDTTPGEVGDVRPIGNSTVIDLRTLPGVDLTGSVARLTTLRDQEAHR